MITEWEWIVPFKGRNHSGSVEQNFLCKAGNVYVMDNHRAALWCWLNELDLTTPHSLIHIDRHPDALQSRLDEWLKHLPSWAAGIDAYLGKTYQSDDFDCPVIRWDNYISIYLREFGDSLTTFRCLTHEDGDPPNFGHPMYSSPWELPENLSYWLAEREGPWIVNIDLDYFYCQFESDIRMMVSDDYIDAVATGLKDAMDRGTIGVLTLCLTPDSYTPGWTATETLAARILERLDLAFQLPNLVEPT
ncbi:hypothetical protein FIU86_21305 (plasmid) [Roseovarius sp. THAF9]|uniref:UPF0489 family protein n=1 Tax=Roseovarius sp. THAF9 TaxID=2587847 RepID=UPI0012697891|nr:UPF0489 family protein [Roseovarius sp. THAF9]QFT95404.1 hypothetical protein FIU86_21305 [Roseovarius sp. THAF9]